jgi:hypothetical protein
MTDFTAPNAFTNLVLSGPGVQPYSARGLTQTLSPINAASSQRRTINGNLKDLSRSQFRKYQSTVNCADQTAPALEGVWPGLQVTVDCVTELSFPTATGGPERTVVPGSSRVDGDFTFYRPRLIMRVVDFNESHDEYGAQVSWSLQLEEE